jgi:hypothetical protein
LDNGYEPQEKNLETSPHRKYKISKESRKDKTSYRKCHQVIKNNQEQSIPTTMNGVMYVNNNEKHGFKDKDISIG